MIPIYSPSSKMNSKSKSMILLGAFAFMDNTKLLIRHNGIAIYEEASGKVYYTKEDHVSVVVLAKHGDQLLLIRQYRAAVDDYVIQLPGGGINEEEDLESAKTP